MIRTWFWKSKMNLKKWKVERKIWTYLHLFDQLFCSGSRYYNMACIWTDETFFHCFVNKWQQGIVVTIHIQQSHLQFQQIKNLVLNVEENTKSHNLFLFKKLENRKKEKGLLPVYHEFQVGPKLWLQEVLQEFHSHLHKYNIEFTLIKYINYIFIKY